MKLVDLSREIYKGMEVYPGDPEVDIELVDDYESKGWQLRRLELGSHTGSHVDAFSHMLEGGPSLSEMELDRFLGWAQLVDLKGPWPKNRGLLFKEELDSSCLDRLIDLEVPFVGANMTEDLERGLLENNIVSYTDLINLDSLPSYRDFFFLGLPLKIRSGDGSPVRALAILDLEL